MTSTGGGSRSTRRNPGPAVGAADEVWELDSNGRPVRKAPSVKPSETTAVYFSELEVETEETMWQKFTRKPNVKRPKKDPPADDGSSSKSSEQRKPLKQKLQDLGRKISPFRRRSKSPAGSDLSELSEDGSTSPRHERDDGPPSRAPSPSTLQHLNNDAGNPTGSSRKDVPEDPTPRGPSPLFTAASSDDDADGVAGPANRVASPAPSPARTSIDDFAKDLSALVDTVKNVAGSNDPDKELAALFGSPDGTRGDKPDFEEDLGGLDDKKESNPPTSYARGPLSKEEREELYALVAQFESDMEAFARRVRRPLSSIWRIASVVMKLTRKPNLYNLFVKKWCMEFKKKDTETFPDYRERFLAAYRARFEDMTPEERERERADLLHWNEEYEKAAAEDLQDDGNLYKVMLQARLEFEELARHYHKFYDIAVFGWVVSVLAGDALAMHTNSSFASTKALSKVMNRGAKAKAVYDDFAALAKVQKAAGVSTTDFSKEAEEHLLSKTSRELKPFATDWVIEFQNKATGRARTSAQWSWFDHELVEVGVRIENWPAKWSRPEPKQELYNNTDAIREVLRQKYQKARGEGDETKMVRIVALSPEERAYSKTPAFYHKYRNLALWSDTNGNPICTFGDAIDAWNASLEGKEAKRLEREQAAEDAKAQKAAAKAAEKAAEKAAREAEKAAEKAAREAEKAAQKAAALKASASSSKRKRDPDAAPTTHKRTKTATGATTSLTGTNKSKGKAVAAKKKHPVDRRKGVTSVNIFNDPRQRVPKDPQRIMHYDDDSSSSASDIDGQLLESEDTAGENSGDDMEVEQLGGNGDLSDNDADRPAGWGEDADHPDRFQHVRPASLAHGSRAPTAHSQRAASMAPFSRAPTHEVPRATSQPPWARAVVPDVAPPYPMGSFSRDHPPESYRTQSPPSLPASAPSRTRPLPLPAPRQGLHGPRPLPGVSSVRRQLPPPPPPPPPGHSRPDYGALVHRQPSVSQPEQRTPSAFDVLRSWPRTGVVDRGRPQLPPRHTADVAQAATRVQHFSQPATSDMYGSGTYDPYRQGGNGQSQSQSQSQDVDMEGAALLHTMTSSSPAGASVRGMYGAPTPSSSMMAMSLFTIPETTEAYGFSNPTNMNNGADGWAESVFGGSNVGASSSGAGWPPGGSSMWDSLT